MAKNKFNSAQGIQSFLRSGLEAGLTVAMATTLILEMASDIGYLFAGSDSITKKPAFKFTVLAVTILAATADWYVHYNIYSDTRYNAKTPSNKNPLLPASATTTGPQAGLSCHSASTGGCHSGDAAKNQTSKPHSGLNAANASAFMCALTCSIKIACAPIVIMTLLRTVGIIDDKNTVQRWTEFGLSIVTTGIATWSATRAYNLAIKHQPGDEPKACCRC